MRAACLHCLLFSDRPTATFWRDPRATVLHAEIAPTAGRDLGDRGRILPNLGSLMRKLTVTQGASGGTCLSAPPSSHNTSLYS